MQRTSTDGRDIPSFAETALRLGGKGDDEARRLGAVDRADEQVETLYAERRRTESSPVHRAVWDAQVPLDLFQPPPLTPTAPCDAAMQKSLDVVRRRREAKTLFDENGKLSDDTIGDLAGAGFWGMLIPPEYGGEGRHLRAWRSSTPGCRSRMPRSRAWGRFTVASARWIRSTPLARRSKNGASCPSWRVDRPCPRSP